MHSLRSTAIALLACVSLATGTAALGFMCEEEGERTTARDPDLAAGAAAAKEGDWERAVAALERVVARRPWDDGAHTLLGTAYRELGRGDRAVTTYRRALDLNPYHRGAMQGLGVAYLDTGDPLAAAALLRRLGEACRRDEGGGPALEARCAEWRGLRAAVARSRSAAEATP